MIAILSWEIGWIDATSRRRLVCPTDVVFADPGFSFEEKLISARVLDRMKRSVSARVFLLAEQPRNTGILVNDGEEDRYRSRQIGSRNELSNGLYLLEITVEKRVASDLVSIT